ncbi:MAG: hypothetical protein IT462_11680 [Planctomycetes bacterium]|nr:hypothetical protein [Planctomycetota bacterium]
MGNIEERNSRRARMFRFWGIVVGGDILLTLFLFLDTTLLARPVASLMGLKPDSEEAKLYAVVFTVGITLAIAIIAAIWWFVSALRSEPTLRS